MPRVAEFTAISAAADSFSADKSVQVRQNSGHFDLLRYRPASRNTDDPFSLFQDRDSVSLRGLLDDSASANTPRFRHTD